MEKIIYIVEGNTGDWEDSYSWNVKGFFNQAKADELCQKLNKIAEKGHIGNFGSTWEERSSHTRTILDTQEKIEAELQEFDPSARIIDSGTTYRVISVTIEMDNE